jgi:tetratricopeptide (TPR) repeat protein
MPNTRHVAPEDMNLFVAGELPPVKAKELVRHLLTGCEHCIHLAKEKGLPEAQEEDYSAVLRRLGLMLVIATNDLDVEIRHGASQWSQLERLSPGARLRALKEDEALWHWGFFKHVLDSVTPAGRNNPLEAVDLAFFALAVVEVLPVESYGEENIHDFRASALTALANAKRNASDYQGAKDAYRAAHEEIGRGSGDLYEKASVICHEALLYKDLGQFEEGMHILDKAYKIFRRVGDIHLCGRTVIQQSTTIGHVDPMQGIALAKRGLEMLDLSREDHFLELSARNALAHFLNDAGYVDEARNVQETYRYLYRKFQDFTIQSRMQWLDGLIAKNGGEYRVAERYFRDLRSAFDVHGFRQEEALVSLDLAEVLLWSGRYKEAADIIHETYPVLEAWGLERDILALWLSLENFVRNHIKEAVTMFREVAIALRRGWNSKRTTAPTFRTYEQ